jgi:hypothetical protein
VEISTFPVSCDAGIEVIREKSEKIKYILTMSALLSISKTWEAVMSDGPFKNIKLGYRWKRFARAVQSDAFDSVECCNLASDALVHEILSSEFQGLLADFQSYTRREQLDFDPLSTVEGIFNRHGKTSMTDTFQKEVMFRLDKQVAPTEVLRQALEASVGEQSREVRSRFEEECIRVHEAGEMRPDQFKRTVNQVGAVIDALVKSDICEAILAGDKNAFKAAVTKKIGLDEGPKL